MIDLQIELTDIRSGRSIQRVEHGLKTCWGVAWTYDGSKVVAVPRR